MCGRFTLTVSGEEVAEAFGLQETPRLEPRYNIAPSQPIAAVRAGSTGASRHLAFLRWGFLPTSGARGRVLLINARAETLGRRPAFREAFERRRCLVPADGFYEWKALEGARRKQPYYFRLVDGRPFALAALWEPPPADDPSGPGACTLVTTAPNGLLAPVHDRMPALLDRDDYDAWLAPEERSGPRVSALLRPFPAERMTGFPVGFSVNDPRNDSPDCCRPA
jgi:putative SOS response-associated peptidase YedK